MVPEGKVSTDSTGEPWSTFIVHSCVRASHIRTVWSNEPGTSVRRKNNRASQQHARAQFCAAPRIAPVRKRLALVVEPAPARM
jgi:hypothetical protein